MDTSIEQLGRLTGLPFVLGIKPYATLFVFGLMLKLGYVTDIFFLQEQFQFFQSNLFLVITLSLFLFETLADKIPLIDHLSDLLHTVLKPLAGAFLGFLIIDAVDINQTLGLAALSFAMVGGGTISLATHTTKSTIRLASTKFTGGIGNMFISSVEDVLAIIGTIMVAKYPSVIGIIVLIFSITFIFIAPKLFRGLLRLVKKLFSFIDYWLGLNSKPE